MGVYKHTVNAVDYTQYKEALNVATTEIRKSKRIFEKKLAAKKMTAKVSMLM